MQTKKWYASKTLWFNLVALLVTVLSAYGYTGELPADWAVFVPVIITAINIVLRLVTKRAVR